MSSVEEALLVVKLRMGDERLLLFWLLEAGLFDSWLNDEVMEEVDEELEWLEEEGGEGGIAEWDDKRWLCVERIFE